MLTGFGNPRYFLHPLEDRPFSLREAARLQGFPDTFVLRPPGVPLPDAFRLVGNAVPAPLARALASQVAAALSGAAPALPRVPIPPSGLGRQVIP